MRILKLCGLAVPALAVCLGCSGLTRQIDRDIAIAIERRQEQALRYRYPIPLREEQAPAADPDRSAYAYVPREQSSELPPAFETTAAGAEPAGAEVLGILTTRPSSAPASQPDEIAAAFGSERPLERYRASVFTLTDALAYAQQYRRSYLTAQEDLFLAALALSLERHLWTPQFAAEIRNVYGNFGEITDFDQAVRFTADLSVSQRLPYGGEFTAQAISTLIRDVKRSITAEEGSSVDLGLRIPFLRGAGHVSREDLIQLERELTYAVRTFERFRRRQLVDVARSYFDLLASQQRVLDAITSIQRGVKDYEQASAMFEVERDLLDKRRAEERLLGEVNRLENERESFRFATDRFKLDIGMPVDEPLGLDDLETIERIEKQILEGRYPLLRRPPAADDEDLALLVAEQSRLDLANVRDQIDDAKRGVSIAKNALLPQLDWVSSLRYDSDPERFNLGAFELARATWRTEIILAMNDRFSERTQYRRSLITVRRAQRSYVEQYERVRVDVRQAINRIRLQERLVHIQQQRIVGARERVEFARLQFDEGLLSNRDVVEAEDALVAALNDLNRAKTDRWTELLNFRLSTETLRIDENGEQQSAPPGG